MISTLMAQLGRHTNAEVNEDQLRHMILNVIRANRKKFTNDFGEIVIAADDRNYWRRETFPYYKASRKKARESSELDWPTIFESLNKIKQEIKDIFPYKVIQVEHAEADDIIASICQQYGKQLGGDPILILSSDKDMKQLQKYSNVSQYNPIMKRWLKCTNVDEMLFEHVMKGDSGDGIPNVLSQDDTFVTGSRQKPLTKKRLQEIKDDINSLDDEVKRNIERNKLLIDLDNIPAYIKEEVINQFEAAPDHGREKMFNYFIEKKLKNLLSDIQDF